MDKYIDKRIRETFRARLLEERKRLGLTQRELSARIGTSQAEITSLESGRFAPKMQILTMLALELGVSMDYLAGITDKREMAE